MHLFLIRHGESWTNANWQRVTENRQMNSDLTEKGEREALLAANYLGDRLGQIDALYASTLNRTVQTAKYFEERFGITAVPDDRIREGGYSYDNGRPIEDDLLPIRKVVRLRSEPHTRFAELPAGVESYNDLRTRAGNFLTDLIKNHNGKKVVVITHGWTINALIDVIFNVPLSRSGYLHLHNTSITYVEYTVGGDERMDWEPWRVYFVGATPHLDVFPGAQSKQEQDED